MFEFKVSQDDQLKLNKVVATLELPKITIEKFRAEKDDLKWAVQQAFNEIIDAIIEKEMSDV